MHKELKPVKRFVLDQEIKRTIRTIIDNCEKDKQEETRKLLKVLTDFLYDQNLTSFSDTVLWLSKNVKGLIPAKSLTENFKDALDLMRLLSNVRQIGYKNFKSETAFNAPKRNYFEDLEEINENYSHDELQKIFNQHIREETAVENK